MFVAYFLFKKNINILYLFLSLTAKFLADFSRQNLYPESVVSSRHYN